MNYPKFLVFLQFSLIAILVALSFTKLTPLRVLIFLIGAVVGLVAIFTNRLGNFTIQPIIKDGAKLVTNGIYSYVRHPMYLSVTIMMSAFVTDKITFILFLALFLVLYLKARREEKLWLAKNPEYQEYKKRTKFIIPFLL
jgi:protein-S-isoprenylcysteine O-methyltransferase Ste14